MEFVFWSKDLHILRTVRCKIFDGPRSQNGVLILKNRWMRTMLYSLQNGTEIHVTLLLITLIFHKTFKNCLFFYKMDDFNFIHYTTCTGNALSFIISIFNKTFKTCLFILKSVISNSLITCCHSN